MSFDLMISPWQATAARRLAEDFPDIQIVLNHCGSPMDRDPGKRRVDFVLGDCHGASCAPRLVDQAERWLRARGYTTARNDPYAGGYVTRHYGRPREGVHSLQVEVARPLYMDEARIERLPRMAAFQRDLTRLVRALAGTHWSFIR